MIQKNYKYVVECYYCETKTAVKKKKKIQIFCPIPISFCQFVLLIATQCSHLKVPCVPCKLGMALWQKRAATFRRLLLPLCGDLE